jgi:hypothetical protein
VALQFSNIANWGFADARSVVVTVANGAGQTADSAPLDIYSLSNATSSVSLQVPQIAPRGAAESSADYEGRLVAQNETLPLQASWVFKDTSGSDYGSREGTGEVIRQVPIVWPYLWGPYNDLPPGWAGSFSADGQRQGPEVFGFRAHFELTGAAPLDVVFDTQPQPWGGAPASTSFDLAAPPLAPRGAQEPIEDYRARLVASGLAPLALTAQFWWDDAIGNHYGPLERIWSRHLAVPVMTASSSSTADGLPGQSASVDVVIGNDGNTTVCGGDIGQAWWAGWVEPGASKTTSAAVPIPTIEPHGEAESNSAYLARLHAAERPIALTTTYNWDDCSTQASYGPADVTLSAREVLPILSGSLGAAVATNGDVTYTMRIDNQGHSRATVAFAMLTLPGIGASWMQLSDPIEVAGSLTYTQTVTGPVTDPLAAHVDIFWIDDGWTNWYGPVSYDASLGGNEAPVVSAGPDQTVSLPALPQGPDFAATTLSSGVSGIRAVAYHPPSGVVPRLATTASKAPNLAL